jgi:lipopolysaccharide export LptBFGC system permease protein LptF
VIKILDWYILKTFLVSLAIVMVALIGLALMLDLFFNVNRWLDLTNTPEKTGGFWSLAANVASYYFYKIFDYYQMLASPAILVAAATTFVRFNRSREMIGIKAAGISLYRVMWPVILVAMAMDGFFILNSEVILPNIIIQLSRTPGDYVAPKSFPVEFIRDEHNNILYAPTYDPSKRQMLSETRETLDGAPSIMAHVWILLRDEKFQPRGTIEATSATWDEAAHVWRLENGVKLPPMLAGAYTEYDGPRAGAQPWDVYASNIDPTAVQRHRAVDYYRYMGYTELQALAFDPMRGNSRQIQVTMHQHVTAPIMNMLLLLLGLPFVAGRDDRNYFMSIGLAMIMVVVVFVVTFAATAFGNTGHISSPLLAAWLPVFLILPASILAMESLKT